MTNHTYHSLCCNSKTQPVINYYPITCDYPVRDWSKKFVEQEYQVPRVEGECGKCKQICNVQLTGV